MKRMFLLLIFAFQFSVCEVRGATVVCIHGFLNNTRSMCAVKNALLCCDYDVVLWQYPSRQKYIEEHACDLVAYLQDTACKFPGQPIHFVTHSIGALILRSALNNPSCPTVAKQGRAVLIAPPSQGSKLARRFKNIFPVPLAMGQRSGWQIMHYTPRDYTCLGEFPPTMPVLVIAGTKGNTIWFQEPNDGLLAVEETRLNTPSYFLSFHVTHGDLLKTKEVLRCIREFITPESTLADSGLARQD